MQIRPYLAYKGNCQEALELYTKAFNRSAAEIMRFSDIPQNPNSLSQYRIARRFWYGWAI